METSMVWPTLGSRTAKVAGETSSRQRTSLSNVQCDAVVDDDSTKLNS